jgi:hypothetical protein
MYLDVVGSIVGRLNENGVPKFIRASVNDCFPYEHKPVYKNYECYECSNITVHYDDYGNFVSIEIGELIPRESK